MNKFHVYFLTTDVHSYLKKEFQNLQFYSMQEWASWRHDLFLTLYKPSPKVYRKENWSNLYGINKVLLKYTWVFPGYLEPSSMAYHRNKISTIMNSLEHIFLSLKMSRRMNLSNRHGESRMLYSASIHTQ